jgi:hypothetical protein
MTDCSTQARALPFIRHEQEKSIREIGETLNSIIQA